jgi:hypothetical protein
MTLTGAATIHTDGHGAAAITDLMHSFGPGVSVNGHNGESSEAG